MLQVETEKKHKLISDGVSFYVNYRLSYTYAIVFLLLIFLFCAVQLGILYVTISNQSKPLVMSFPVHAHDETKYIPNIKSLKKKGGDSVEDLVLKYLLSYYVGQRELYDKSFFSKNIWLEHREKLASISSSVAMSGYKEWYIDDNKEAGALLKYKNKSSVTPVIKDVELYNTGLTDEAVIHFDNVIKTSGQEDVVEHRQAMIKFTFNIKDSGASKQELKFMILEYTSMSSNY